MAGQQIILRRVGQGGADIGDVDHPDQACFAGHRQMPDMPGHHGSGRVPDACPRVDDGRMRGNQGPGPDVVDVLPVGTAWTMSVSVMMPTGCLAWSSSTTTRNEREYAHS